MKQFFQSLTLIEGLTISIALLALVISVISFFNTSNRDRRQLRIGRIEEIIEIIHVLMGNYQYFEDTFSLQKDMRNQNLTDSDESEKNQLLSLERKQVEALHKISAEINLQQKLIRLTVLINTYLPNDGLRNKIRSFVSLYTSLGETTLNGNYHKTKEIYSTYPRPWILLPFVEKIQTGLIKEMNLGYTNNIYSENLFEDEFRKELNL